MSSMIGLIKKWMRIGVLVAFLLAGFQLADVFAETGVSDEGNATVTIHVLSADAEEPDTPDIPTPDDDPDVYPDPVVPDDDPDQTDVDPSDGGQEDQDETEGNDDEEESDNSDSDNEESEEEIVVPNTSAGTGEGPDTPDTGGNLVGDETGNNESLLSILIIGAMIILGVVIWHYKGNKHGVIKFDGERNRWLGLFNWQRVASIAIVGGVVIIVSLLIVKEEKQEEVMAAGFVYPYTVEVDDDGHYDVYVRQGELKETAFAIRTRTDNLTGYTLNMATEKQILTNGNDAQIKMVNDGTAKSNFANNTWGFSTDGSNYGTLPVDRKNGKMVRQTKGASPNGNLSVAYFAVKVAEDMPLGDYSTTLYLEAATNPVNQSLTLANGNVAKVTRVSDNSTISKNTTVILGEELKISNSTDVAGIAQTAIVNGKTVGNDSTITVDGDMEIGTIDDSLHFLKNDYENNSNSAIGDAILVKSQGKYWLVDTGRGDSSTGKPKGSTIEAYLNKLNIKSLDYVLLTHAHSDHMGGVDYLISKGFINSKTTVYMRGCEAAMDENQSFCNGRLSNLKTKANANVIDFYNHESERASMRSNGIELGNFKITMFNIDDSDSNGHIDRNNNRENLNSIGMKLVHKGSNKSVFLAADWEWGVEDKYGSSIGNVDILKAGHHGAKTSNTYEFIKALSPKMMVMTSKNVATSYGNPQRQAAAWAYVEQGGGKAYFTGDVADNSAVSINFTSSGYAVKTGKTHSILTDANTQRSDDGQQSSKPYHWSWKGGLLGWYYPKNKTGEGSDYTDWAPKYYVYVYQKKSDAGNILSHVNRCVDGYTYKFDGSSVEKGVSKGRTKGCS